MRDVSAVVVNRRDDREPGHRLRDAGEVRRLDVRAIHAIRRHRPKGHVVRDPAGAAHAGARAVVVLATVGLVDLCGGRFRGVLDELSRPEVE